MVGEEGVTIGGPVDPCLEAVRGQVGNSCHEGNDIQDYCSIIWPLMAAKPGGGRHPAQSDGGLLFPM